MERQFLYLRNRCINIAHIVEIVHYERDSFDENGIPFDTECFRIIYNCGNTVKKLEIHKIPFDFRAMKNYEMVHKFMYGV